MKKIMLTGVLILTGIIAQAQGTLLYQVEANWEAVSDSNAPLRIEDFAGGPDFSINCGVVISSLGDSCFSAGELEPFFEIRTANNSDVRFVIPGGLGDLQTEPVIIAEGTNNGDYPVINFDTSLENISRVSFDVFAETGFNTNMANIRVFDTTGALLATLNPTLILDDFTFVGIQSTTAIGRVEIEDASEDTSLAITDLRYGITRVNDDQAISLTIGEDFEDFDITSSNVFATDTSVFTGIAEPSCANYTGSDVLFALEVPSNGNVTVETRAESGSAITDTGMAILDANGEELDCDDDDGQGNFSLISLENRTPGEILFVRVWTFNGVQNGEFKISAYSEEVLTINENDAPSQIEIYPNPTTDIINIKSMEPGATIEIFNMLGQKVLATKGTGIETQIDLSNQPAGTYLINITSGKTSSTKQVIKK